ncbi:hypothetical protein K474DRAFT_1662804 [Panus rudis PR-1116 ss-1]|nr:hypothetical protein K474DRAFT_1662804 [Panus rudis PR-1116 ss-1]
MAHMLITSAYMLKVSILPMHAGGINITMIVTVLACADTSLSSIRRSCRRTSRKGTWPWQCGSWELKGLSFTVDVITGFTLTCKRGPDS